MDFEDDPLQNALATAFEDAYVPDQPQATHLSFEDSWQPALSAVSELPAVPSEAGTITEMDESWKTNYDNLVSGWRAESAVAREKAERERERWRVIREREELEPSKLESGSKGSKEVEWETVQRAARTQEAKPISAVEDSTEQPPATTAGISNMLPRRPLQAGANTPSLISPEALGGKSADSPVESLPSRPDPSISEYGTGHETHGDVSAAATAPPSNPDSRTWEEIPSLESSFPSLSFPDRSAAPSPEPRPRPPPAPSVTLAIFDSSLSTRTRVLALVSSLAINLFLPFINGMMLGFGEIFAKNVVGAFGWKLPGMGVGIRAASRRT